MTLATSQPEEWVTESAADLQTAYLMCRTFRHPWDPYTDNSLPPPTYGVRLSMRCPRCGMQRHDIRDWRGERGALLSRRYIAPYDYRLSGEVGNAELWEEVLVRLDNGQLALKAKKVRPPAQAPPRVAVSA
jgi:hypothetical protein